MWLDDIISEKMCHQYLFRCELQMMVMFSQLVIKKVIDGSMLANKYMSLSIATWNLQRNNSG